MRLEQRLSGKLCRESFDASHLDLDAEDHHNGSSDHDVIDAEPSSPQSQLPRNESQPSIPSADAAPTIPKRARLELTLSKASTAKASKVATAKAATAKAAATCLATLASVCF